MDTRYFEITSEYLPFKIIHEIVSIPDKIKQSKFESGQLKPRVRYTITEKDGKIILL